MKARFAGCFILWSVLTGVSASAQVDTTPPVPTNIADAIKADLAHPSAPLSRYKLNLNNLRQFYMARSYAPAWSGDPERDRDASNALDILVDADTDGLDPAAYRIDAIRSRESKGSLAALAEYDVMLTAGVLEYIRDLHMGRVGPSQIENDIELPAIGSDPVSTLSSALTTNTLQQSLAALRPPHQEYENLKLALARYRAIQSEGGWPQVSAKLVDDDATSVLWHRLAFEDQSLDPATEVPAALADAISRYQARNGLEETGNAGRETLAALNIPVSQRIDQIVVNMERWRWLPAFAEQYIEVNTADATLKVVDRGSVVLASRIIAGKRATPTPMFTARVVALTVNPYWNIPATIARNEILPKERRHPGYMASQHIFVAEDGTLKQQPGADNALGFLKLEMPNRFNAYLHDTPARSLFARNDRHFSHGCMRVQQIAPLASYALTGDTAEAKEKLDALIASGVNQRISLDRSLPVYVLYWTAIADQNGAVGFRPDIYGRDGRLLAALAGQHLFGRVSLNIDCQAEKAG
ncbi:MAG TPA: L,D-transpeptidase family protein [Rhizomicrobium sp.]